MEKEKPAVILLDLMMPEMDGFQFLEERRLHEDWGQVPVIVFTCMELSEDDKNRLSGQVAKILDSNPAAHEGFADDIQRLVAETLSR